MTDRPSRLRALAVPASLAALALASHGASLWNGFINLDDPPYVLQNPHVTGGLTAEGVAWAFTAFHSNNWHPLTWLSHMLDVQLWGLEPFGHHLGNVLLHAVTSVLVFLALRRATGAHWRSAAVAALFACHPVHVESVAWVAERKDTLSAALFWLLLLVYVSGRSRRHALLALTVFAAGLMAKPMLVTAPLVLLLVDVWPLRRLPPGDGLVRRAWAGRGLLLEKWPYFALALGCGLLTLVAQHRQGGGAIVYESPLLLNAGNAVLSYARYLGKLAWPADLAILYPFRRTDLTLPAVALAAALLAGLSALVAWQRERRPWLAFGWAWYLVALLPVIGFLRIGFHSFADRYLYIPAVGLYVALVWTAAEWVERVAARRRIAAAGFGALVAVLALLSWRQERLWRSSITLFEHTVAVAWDNPAAHRSLAQAYAAAGDLARATRHARIGQVFESEERAALNPSAPRAHYLLGAAYAGVGRHAEAVVAFEKALRLEPRFTQARLQLGVSLAQLERIEEAIGAFEDVLREQPENRDAAYNLEVMRGALRARQLPPQPSRPESLR